MDDQVSWRPEMTVKPGELDNLKGVDQGNGRVDPRRACFFNDQWCISDDITLVHNFDRYSDSAEPRRIKTGSSRMLRALHGSRRRTQPGYRCTALRATR